MSHYFAWRRIRTTVRPQCWNMIKKYKQTFMFAKMNSAWQGLNHNNDVIMTTIASQITSLTAVYSAVYSDADQRKHRSSASLAFVWGIHRDRWIPRTKGQLMRKMLPFDDVIMNEISPIQVIVCGLMEYPFFVDSRCRALRPDPGLLRLGIEGGFGGWTQGMLGKLWEEDSPMRKKILAAT